MKELTLSSTGVNHFDTSDRCQAAAVTWLNDYVGYTTDDEIGATLSAEQKNIIKQLELENTLNCIDAKMSSGQFDDVDLSGMSEEEKITVNNTQLNTVDYSNFFAVHPITQPAFGMNFADYALLMYNAANGRVPEDKKKRVSTFTLGEQTIAVPLYVEM